MFSLIANNQTSSAAESTNPSELSKEQIESRKTFIKAWVIMDRARTEMWNADRELEKAGKESTGPNQSTIRYADLEHKYKSAHSILCTLHDTYKEKFNEEFNPVDYVVDLENKLKAACLKSKHGENTLELKEEIKKLKAEYFEYYGVDFDPIKKVEYAKIQNQLDKILSALYRSSEATSSHNEAKMLTEIQTQLDQVQAQVKALSLSISTRHPDTSPPSTGGAPDHAFVVLSTGSAAMQGGAVAFQRPLPDLSYEW
jgi:hypothetical protein